MKGICGYNKANFESLNNKIENYNWNNLRNCSLNEACFLFTNTFIDFVKECITSKTITVRPDDQPWFDSNIKNFVNYGIDLKQMQLRQENKKIGISIKNHAIK